MQKLKALKGWIFYYYHFIYFTLKISIAKNLQKASWPIIWSMAQEWAKKSLNDFHIEVIIIGKNPSHELANQQVIIIPNHRSWFDHISIMHALNICFHPFAKAGFYQIPFLGSFFTNTEFIPVHDKKLNQEMKNTVQKYIRKKESLLLFFEGTRGSGKTLLPFRKGAFSYAAKNKIPLLPVFVLNSENILSKEKSLLSIKSGKIFLVFDELFYISIENFDEELKAFENKYRKKHDELYEKYAEKNQEEQ